MPPRGAARPDVGILCGPTRSDRHARMLDRLRAHWGSAVLLVPSNRLATQRLEDLLLSSNLPGAWDRPVQTLQSFAAELLRERGANITLLSDFERRAILEQALDTLRDSEQLQVVADAAETPGFVNHMLRVITQLKQAAIEPADFRTRIMESGRRHWLDPIVAAVYEVYQAALIASARYDLVGFYWQSELACREQRPQVFDHVRHAVLDGFDDFTPSEFRLLRAVAPHLDSLTFSMSCSLASASQRDLYATPRETVRRVQTTFHARVDEFSETPPETFCDYLRQHLFWRDLPDPPPDCAADLCLAVYTNPVHEIEGVVRTIKRLIVDKGVPPRAIAVLYRDLNEFGDLLHAVFDEFGLPATIDMRPSLARSGIGHFLLSLLDISPAWGRDAVLDVMTSPWFAPDNPSIREHRGAFPTLARLAQIVEGRQDWDTKMQSLPGLVANSPSREAQRARAHHAQLAPAAAAMQAAWKMLKTAVRPLQSAATECAFIAAARQAAESLKSLGAIASLPDDAWQDHEQSAWNAFEHLLDRLAAWASVSNGATRSGDFSTRFRQAVGATTYTVVQPRDGVQIMNVEAARHLAFDYVFFCGLVEGAVPKPPAASAIYTDRDIEALGAAGIALESRQGRNARERLLFHHGLSLARKRLYLSWHARNRQDKEVGPSPYVADVHELADDRAPLHDMRLDPLPGIGDACSLRELRNAAVAQGRVVPGFEQAIEPALAAATLERRRYGPEAFDEFDGQIGVDALLASVRDRFGPSHRFSARQLEAYARCPFRFLAQEIFKLEPVEEPAPEIDPMLRGSIMHAALQQFYTRYKGRPIASLDRAEAAQAIREAVGQAWDRLAARDRATPPGVRAAETARLTAQLLRHLDIERARDDDWLPMHFEVAFGRDLDERADPWSRADPFVLDTAEGPILLAGVIDRIDETAGTLRIVDYKNSIAIHSKAALDDGVDLQLLLYAETVERYLATDQTCLHAQYVHVGRKDFRECLGDSSANRRALMKEKIAAYVHGIRDGRFFPTPYKDSCSYCAMRRVCRYDAGRIARKESNV